MYRYLYRKMFSKTRTVKFILAGSIDKPQTMSFWSVGDFY